MCGVFALLYRRPLTKFDIDLGRRGTTAVAYRGPDASGEWVDKENGVYLGHRRLSVIDLSHDSDQPMVLRNLSLSYNGEIYNYRSVRERLKGLGTTVNTLGDTEVLLAAWQQWGRAALEYLDGMFGFALWDGESAWLALDRFGEKRLYYAETEDGVVVCSELRVLAEVLALKPNLKAEQVAAYMTMGYIPGPHTAYPEIKHIMPANVLRIVRGEVVERHRYWQPPFGSPGKGPIKPLTKREIDSLQSALVESVQSRLEADAATCLFLSAGVDSCLIAAIAAKDLDRNLDCFTVSFPVGETHDEADAAEETAAYLGLPHQKLKSQDDLTNVSAEYYLDLHGQPCDDLTLASLHQMAIAASGMGYKVALTGVGGDEVIYGYNKHTHFFEQRHYYNMPEWIRRLMGHLLSPVAGNVSKAAVFCDLFSVRDSERYIAQKNQPTLSALRLLPGFGEWADKTFANSGMGIEFQVPQFEMEEVLANHRLVSGDLGAMRTGLETRTPFLSPGLMNTIAEFDPRSLLKFGQKTAFRRVLKRYLPEKMVDRPKLGFVFPADRFLQHYDCPELSGVFPPHLASQIWNKRTQQGWRTLAVRMLVLDQFDRWAQRETIRD
jgi:asparagine synthase (glutamine-hydrolysing)